MSNQEIEQLSSDMENLSLKLNKEYIVKHIDEFEDYCQEYERFGTDDADEYKIVNEFKSKVSNQRGYEYSTFNFTDFFVFGTIECFLEEIPKITLPELKKLCDDLAITKYSNYIKSRSKKDVVVEYITAFVKYNNQLVKEKGTDVRNEIIKCLTINHNVTYERFYVVFIDKEDDRKYEFINNVLEYDPNILLQNDESDETTTIVRANMEMVERYKSRTETKDLILSLLKNENETLKNENVTLKKKYDTSKKRIREKDDRIVTLEEKVVTLGEIEKLITKRQKN